ASARVTCWAITGPPPHTSDTIVQYGVTTASPPAGVLNGPRCTPPSSCHTGRPSLRPEASHAATSRAPRLMTSRPRRPVCTAPAAGAHQSPRAFRLVVRPDVPRITGAARTDVDRFVLAALEAKGLALNREADRATLARRVCFDLTGLPPTVPEIDAFLADTSPD